MTQSDQVSESQRSRPEAIPSPAPLRDPLVEAMRRHLVAARPESSNEALRLLRSAFPHVPLATRVEAAGGLSPSVR